MDLSSKCLTRTGSAARLGALFTERLKVRSCENIFIPTLINKSVEVVKTEAKEVTLWGAGIATREFMYVVDCAKPTSLAIIQFGFKASTGFELGFKEPFQWYR